MGMQALTLQSPSYIIDHLSYAFIEYLLSTYHPLPIILPGMCSYAGCVDKHDRSVKIWVTCPGHSAGRDINSDVAGSQARLPPGILSQLWPTETGTVSLNIKQRC